MLFEDRFILLRGSKVNNERIRLLRPELLLKPSVLSVWKLTSRYFLLDLLTNQVILHCKYLTSGNSGHTCDISPLAPYRVVPDETHFAVAESMCGNVSYWGNVSLSIENVYAYNNKWIFIQYNFLGQQEFIINSKGFVDFETYFTRDEKLNRFFRNNLE